MADILAEGTTPEQVQVIHSRPAQSFDEGQLEFLLRQGNGRLTSPSQLLTCQRIAPQC